ncbi:MAG: HNH endonuclease [Burkholderiaceae bacterium]|nr:HNH endonuclease [Burkholderiaceae bacterium]
MPSAAPRPCTHAGCGKLVLGGGGRCAAHPIKAWAKHDNAPKRITGRRLQKMRADLFRRQPLCEHCLARDLVTPATQRDHRIPLSEGGKDTEENEQALCDECHEVKSKAEAARGRGASKV